jgi:ribosomal protein S18 acetylase RimI-like enzyme
VTYATIVVSRSYRGIGGVYLMLALEKAAMAAGADYLVGSVRTNNVEVVRLVKSLGWSVLSEDAEFVQFRKNLKSETRAPNAQIKMTL